MCKIYDKSEVGFIGYIGDGSIFEKRYGSDLGRKVYNKVRNKVNSCRERGIEFSITWEMLDLLIDKWVLGKGSCDYTKESFSISLTSTLRPTLERVDSSLGYEEGNLCVVTYKANCIKSKFENYEPDVISVKIQPSQKDLFIKMWAVLCSPKKINSTVNQYVPKKQIEEIKPQVNEIKMEEPMQELIIHSTNHAEKKEAHEDVMYATRYANFMKYLIKQGKEVTISFPQFKHLFKRKNCFLSGTKFESDDEKIPVLLSDEVGKDTLVFAFEKYANPFQSLINQEGMTITLLKNMLVKNLK